MSEEERDQMARLQMELNIYGLAYKEILRDVSQFVERLEDATPKMADTQKKAIAAYRHHETGGLELPDLPKKMKTLLVDGRRFRSSLEDFRTSFLEFALRLLPEMSQPDEDMD